VATSGLLYKPQVIHEDECGAIGGMKIGRGTEVLGENLPRRHFVDHKSHMTRPGLNPRVATVGSQRLTAWAMPRPILSTVRQISQKCRNISCLSHLHLAVCLSVNLLLTGLWRPFSEVSVEDTTASTFVSHF
jgi:hypothetical protein